MVASTLKNKQNGRGWRPRQPTFTRNNFLSDQGLGGAWELAIAKASVRSRRLSIRTLTTLFGHL